MLELVKISHNADKATAIRLISQTLENYGLVVKVHEINDEETVYSIDILK